MAYNGYFTWGGAEFLNASRTKAYTDLLKLHFVKNTFSIEGFSAMIGQPAYVSPVADPAPWYDSREPISAEFAGVIPLEVNGVSNSSRESDYVDFITDGGQAGRIRHSAKAIVFSVALVGKNEEAVEYGFRWLKRTLLLSNCAPGTIQGCDGLDLRYAAAQPTPDDMPGAWARLDRHLKNVTFRDGPKITSQQTIPGKGEFWVVQFTCDAGDGFEYGPPHQILEGLNNGDPFVPGPGAPGSYGTATVPPQDCSTPSYLPMFDPDFPMLIAPPMPPDVMPTAFNVPTGNWARAYANLSAVSVPKWDEVRPIIAVRSTSGVDQRMIRVRFYPMTSATTDDCGAVGEYLITYLPAGYSLTIDTSEGVVYVEGSGVVTQRADSLVYGNIDGRPVTYFGLSCGMPYRVTMDWPSSTAPALEMDLDFVLRTS